MAANLELEKTPSGFGLGIDDECFITGALSAAAREALLSIGVPVSAGNTQGANAQNSARIVRIDGEPVSNLRDIVGSVCTSTHRRFDANGHLICCTGVQESKLLPCRSAREIRARAASACSQCKRGGA
eukprot:SAG31_NODE_29_length_32663_cov_14.779695_7_plen_128_part_00